MGPADVIGHPLIEDQRCVALSQDDLLVRFSPKLSTELITIAHPVAGTHTPDLAPTGMFGGYPLAKSTTGYVFGDDQVHPYLATFLDLTRPVWHRDIWNTLGVPAVQGDVIFTNVGGPNALSTLVAVRATTGETLWEFAPFGFPKDPFVPIVRKRSRPLNLLEQIELQRMKSVIASNPKLKKAAMDWTPPTSTKMGTITPALDSIHGHWLNPGIVAAGDRIYGEVGQRIVALAKDSGAEIWAFDLKSDEVSRSIAATKDYLFVSLPKRLVALSLEDGSLKWSVEVPRSGTLSIGSGRVFLAMGQINAKAKDGGEILAFGTDSEKSRR